MVMSTRQAQSGLQSTELPDDRSSFLCLQLTHYNHQDVLLFEHASAYVSNFTSRSLSVRYMCTHFTDATYVVVWRVEG